MFFFFRIAFSFRVSSGEAERGCRGLDRDCGDHRPNVAFVLDESEQLGNSSEPNVLTTEYVEQPQPEATKCGGEYDAARIEAPGERTHDAHRPLDQQPHTAGEDTDHDRPHQMDRTELDVIQRQSANRNFVHHLQRQHRSCAGRQRRKHQHRHR